MKADVLHTKLVDLLIHRNYPHGYCVEENDETFLYFEKTLAETNPRTRKVLLHWLKGLKDLFALSNKNMPFREYALSPKSLLDQMLDHLAHLDHAQKIKAPVNYDPLSYKTHYDCCHIVKDYPLPAKPIDPNKSPYLEKVAEMFDDDNKCYTVYKFIHRKKHSLYKSPKEAFTAIMRSHFGEHAMPWCICDDSPSDLFNSPNYKIKFMIFKNDKLYAASAYGHGFYPTLFDRLNRNVGVLYPPSNYEGRTKYFIWLRHIFEEDDKSLISKATSAFVHPVIPGTKHQTIQYASNITTNTPRRVLISGVKGFQWSSNLNDKDPSINPPPQTVRISGTYTSPYKTSVKYDLTLTLHTKKDRTLPTVTYLEITERNANVPPFTEGSASAYHEYHYQMTPEKASAMIKQSAESFLTQVKQDQTKE